MKKAILSLALCAIVLVIACEDDTLKSDTSVPVVEDLSLFEGAFVNKTITISADASDNRGVLRVQFFVDGQLAYTDDRPQDDDGTFGLNPWTFDWNTITYKDSCDGCETFEDSMVYKDSTDHILFARAVDAAGNTGDSPKISVTIDRVVPTIDISSISIPNDTTVTGIVAVAANVNDDREVVMFKLYVDGQLLLADSSAPWDLSWNTTGYSDSSLHVVYMKAFDEAGNYDSTSAITVTVLDDSPPSVQIESPAQGDTVSGTVAVVAAFDDNIDVVMVDFYVDSALVVMDTSSPEYVMGSFNWNTTVLDNSSYHSIYSVVQDAAGNLNTSSEITVMVLNDKMAPNVSITYPVSPDMMNPVEVSDTVIITVEATDDKYDFHDSLGAVVAVVFIIDTTTIGVDSLPPWSYEWVTAEYSTTIHTLKISAIDSAGNIGNAQTVWVKVVDAISPTVEITKPAHGTTVAATTRIIANARDDRGVTQVEFYIDGECVSTLNDTPWVHTWNTTTCADSSQHEIYSKAYDEAGNSDSSSILNVTVINPPMAITDLQTTDSSLMSITLSWTAPGADSLEGTASEYDIRYSSSTITDYNWASATECSGEPVPGSSGDSESFEVTGLDKNRTYFFAIKTGDETPHWSGVSNTVVSATTLFAVPLVHDAIANSDPLNSASLAFSSADLDGDGANDLIVTAVRDTVFTETFSFDTTLQVMFTIDTTVCDIRYCDTIFIDTTVSWSQTVVKTNGLVTISLGNGDGTFQSPVEYLAGKDPVSVFPIDLNGDGACDLAIANATSTSTLVDTIIGEVIFSKKIVFDTTICDIHISDTISFDSTFYGLDTNVWIDSVSRVSVLINNGDGTFEEPVYYWYSQINPSSIASADLDGFSGNDLVVANEGSNNVAVFLNNGEGLFPNVVYYSVGSAIVSKPANIFPVDLNNDDLIDIAVANGAGDVSILINNGGGVFSNSVNWWSGQNTSSVFSADFNADGASDLVVANEGIDNIAILLNKGNGDFYYRDTDEDTYEVGEGPTAVVASDFDNDGLIDVAVANSASNNISILLGCGDGIFGKAVNYGPGAQPNAIFSGDFNNDGYNDLAVANSASGTVSIFLNMSLL